jgi:hypothetical protein
MRRWRKGAPHERRRRRTRRRDHRDSRTFRRAVNSARSAESVRTSSPHIDRRSLRTSRLTQSPIQVRTGPGSPSPPTAVSVDPKESLPLPGRGVRAAPGRRRIVFASLAGPGLLLVMGLWTPLAGIAVAAIELSRILTADDLFASVLAATMGGALAMLGPGRWSVDARLFGWKRIEASPRRTGSNSR